jgi:FkbM family methyltransferase
MKIAKVALSRIGAMLGLELVPQWRMKRLAQSAYLRDLLSTLEVDCVFDVGANNGQYRDYLRNEIGFTGLILSFEPNPDCVRILQKRSPSDTSWRVFSFALGAQPGHLELRMTKDSQLSSFLDPNESMGNAGAVGALAKVEVKTLDDVFNGFRTEFNFKRPFLKLDTQGFDLQVIEGGANCLNGFQAIQSEVSNIAIYRQIPNFATSIAYVQERGFALGNMFPANPEQFPFVIDFDAYFVPARHLPARNGSKAAAAK